MKKVLILTVIAILALGVMTMAYTTFYGSPNEDGNGETATISSTCSEAALSVISTIGVEQGYIATATSYNASFCGATGNPLVDEFTSFTGSAYAGQSGSFVLTSVSDAVLLSDLEVRSNAATINVVVTGSLADSGGNTITPPVSWYGEIVFGSSAGAPSFTANQTSTTQTSYVTLPLDQVGSENYYQGTLSVILNGGLGQWPALAGRYTLTTVFTIVPANNY